MLVQLGGQRARRWLSWQRGSTVVVLVADSLTGFAGYAGAGAARLGAVTVVPGLPVSEGVRIVVSSAYRSYATQKALLARKIREYGSESLARRYNAAPGRSEHQTGLAVDLWDGVTWGVGVRNTKTGKWLWANAWRYGFILRYPNGKEKITGYAFEPWHYRYIGARAKDFGANSNQTLEEYLGLA